MIVSQNKVVSLIYELRVNGKAGEVIEKVDNNSPLTFLFGTGSLLPKFEDNLAGLKVGDSFDFNLVSEDAYGQFDEGSVIKVPLQAFQMDGKVDYDLVKIGNKIPMQDSEGHRLTGVVKTVDTDSVTMDFNHPLAGNHLFFKGEITDIRQATEEEITHGHLHSAGSCEGCDSCGGEHDSCCS
ncbi:MAG: peptidylprolyl isomerase [Bacteroidales bacterium]|nr:peptidylprolyl isomerase [Bacteroidales bacterium]